MAGSKRPSRATRKSKPRYEEVESSEDDDYSKTNAHSGKDDDDMLPPGVACAKCHSKKVKCDGTRPYCLRNAANREDGGSSDGGSSDEEGSDEEDEDEDDEASAALLPGVACPVCRSKKVKCNGKRAFCLRNKAKNRGSNRGRGGAKSKKKKGGRRNDDDESDCDEGSENEVKAAPVKTRRRSARRRSKELTEPDEEDEGGNDDNSSKQIDSEDGEDGEDGSDYSGGEEASSDDDASESMMPANKSTRRSTRGGEGICETANIKSGDSKQRRLRTSLSRPTKRRPPPPRDGDRSESMCGTSRNNSDDGLDSISGDGDVNVDRKEDDATKTIDATKRPKYAMGTSVSKIFHDDVTGTERPYAGNVMRYNPDTKLYTIQYEDNDAETMDEGQLGMIVGAGCRKVGGKRRRRSKLSTSSVSRASTTDNDETMGVDGDGDDGTGDSNPEQAEAMESGRGHDASPPGEEENGSTTAKEDIEEFDTATNSCRGDMSNEDVTPSAAGHDRPDEEGGDKPTAAIEDDTQRGEANSQFASASASSSKNRGKEFMSPPTSLTVKASPALHRKKAISTGWIAAPPLVTSREELKGVDDDGDSEGGMRKLSKNEGKRHCQKDSDGNNTMLNLAPSGDNIATGDEGAKVDAVSTETKGIMSRLVTDESTPELLNHLNITQQQTPSMMEMKLLDRPLSSSKMQVAGEKKKTEQRTTPTPTLSMSISYPQKRKKRTRHEAAQPSVGQLKMALYLEATSAHPRGENNNCAPERIFANYWEALERYITLGSYHGVTTERQMMMRSDDVNSNTSPSLLSGMESTLSGFLKTRKMKRLHNKLVLAIMTEALKTDVPSSSCSSHIPQQWQTKTIQSTIPRRLNEEGVLAEVECRDKETDLRQWTANVGPHSGTWTVCGDEIVLTKSDTGQSIHPELVGSRNLVGVLGPEEEFLPSARLPGMVEMDPLIRRHAANMGLRGASADAKWMLVCAVREYSASVIRKIISNDEDFDGGYAPSLPNHFQTSLACQHLTPSGDGLDGGGKLGESGKKRGKKRLINSTSLSHVLAENPSAELRLTSMRSAITPDDTGGTLTHRPGLDNVNCIVNSSIELAARKRLKSSPEYQNYLSEIDSKSTSPARTNKSNPSLSSRNKPQIAAQRTDQPLPLPVTSQSQLAGPLPSQNRQQPPQIIQMKNNSDHPMESSPVTKHVVLPTNSLTKPGFPGMTNTCQKSPSPPPEEESLRTSWNLAESENGNTGGDDANDLEKESEIKRVEGESDEKTGDTKEDEDKKEETKPSVRGFGVKNLKRMRERASFVDSEA